MSAMNDLIGRENEIDRLNRALEEKEAQLILVYGRRRVGKTFLINEYFNYDFDFKFTGSYDQSTQIQLKNFILELERCSKKEYAAVKDWTEAFFLLRDYLESKPSDEKQVVFFDEMPWMDKQKSGFLPAFEWFWNAWASTRKNLVFIACGSAASWLTDNIEKNKGGLFNRCTCKLHLKPLNLHDVEQYLISRDICWSRYDITQCYMIMGGIPYYLRLLDRRLTLNENIDELFFRNGAELYDEFEQLYRTLFKNSDQYIRIVEALSRKRKGLTRAEIESDTKFPQNGTLTKILDDLINAGFVRINPAYRHKSRDMHYQLSDYYTKFFFSFVRDNSGKTPHLWSDTNDDRQRSAWQGFTFEQVCKDHIEQIKKALGIAAVKSEISSWMKKGDGEEKGAQIDLVIDRHDRVISLCEIKFYTDVYDIKKEDDEALKTGVRVFREETKTNKTLQLVMITTCGIKKNMYSNYVSRVIDLDQLFEKA